MKIGMIITISSILFFSGFVFSKDHFISFSNIYIESPSEYYYVGDVIDATGEGSCIGYILKKGIPEPLFFKENMGNELLSFLQNQFYERESLTQLVIRINRLYYYEAIFSGFENKIKIVDLNCTFIIKDSLGFHKVFDVACSTSSKKQLLLPSEVIALAFEKAFNQFHERMEQGYLNKLHISSDNLIYNPLKDRSYLANQLDIVRAKRGIFRTFYDFRDNTPDTTANLKIRYKDKKTELSDIMLHTATPYNGDWEEMEGIWGFSDGKKIYWFVDNKYYLLEKNDSSYFVGMAGNQNLSYPGIGAITGAGFGGLSNGFSGSVVGAVGGALVGSLFTAASAKLVKVKLNFNTGTYDTYLSESQKKVESGLLFYASGYNSTESGINLILNGEYCCTILPDTYTTIALPSNIREVQATFTTDNKVETKIDIVPSLFKTEYYFCLEKKKKPIRVTKANFEKKEFLNRSIGAENKVVSNCY